jgi:hypothetical protein
MEPSGTSFDTVPDRESPPNDPRYQENLDCILAAPDVTVAFVICKKTQLPLKSAHISMLCLLPVP